VTRCGNFYGGGDLNFNRIVPGTVRSIFNGEAPVIRSDGSLIRDYFYVEDGVEAYMMLAAKMDDKKICGEAFNFSNEIQVTVLGVVNKVIEAMGSDLKPVILNQVSNEIRHQYLSAKKARRMLRWKPRYTLDEGMKRTVAWYLDFFRAQEDSRRRSS
jgi:CDP-glucose 4,6-dehydratase